VVTRSRIGRAAEAPLGRRREQAVDDHVEAELEALPPVAARHRRAECGERRVALGVERAEALGELLDLALLVLGIAVELAIEALLVGDRGHVERQEVAGVRGRLVRGAAGLEQREHRLDAAHRVLARRDVRHRQQRDPGEVLGHHLHHAPRELLELLAPPRRVDRIDLDRPDRRVEQQRVQLVAVADVDVQRRGAGVERPGDAAHADRLEAFRPRDIERGRDNRVAAQRRLGRPLPAAARRRRAGHGDDCS
jgi:hypothetical protein